MYIYIFFFLYSPSLRREKSVGISLTELFVGLVNSIIILHSMILFLFETGIYRIEKIRFLGSHCQ